MDNILRLNYGDSRITEALRLAEQVFMECEAPIYPKGSAKAFLDFLYGESLSKKLARGGAFIWICERDGEIIGMMSVRDGSHICLAFVKRGFRGQGVGSRLLDTVTSTLRENCFTVNASPPGLPFYLKRGFVPSDMEQIEDGIIYTPMKRKGIY